MFCVAVFVVVGLLVARAMRPPTAITVVRIEPIRTLFIVKQCQRVKNGSMIPAPTSALNKLKIAKKITTSPTVLKKILD